MKNIRKLLYLLLIIASGSNIHGVRRGEACPDKVEYRDWSEPETLVYVQPGAPARQWLGQAPVAPAPVQPVPVQQQPLAPIQPAPVAPAQQPQPAQNRVQAFMTFSSQNQQPRQNPNNQQQ